MAPVIKARDLFKCYPGFPPVLRGVNIEVEPGEMVAIMGPSGCGKSTMLHILGMLHRPDSGILTILDKDVLALSSEQTAAFRRGNMGFVMQASNLFEHSTVFENVEFPLIYENVPPQERWERVIRALELVRLSSRVHYRSNRLSGGEQQRVAIARAMVNNPRILLADEPTGALDARTSAVIMENFRSLCHKGGVAMVMVTHDPKMAEYCDSIYTLEEGVLNCKKHEPPRIQATSTPDVLNLPEPLVRGALVAWRFPGGASRNILELSRRMHSLRLLARIYSLKQDVFLGGQSCYSLPLAVRHMHLRQRLFGCWRSGTDNGATLAQMRRELAAAGGMGIFWRRLALCGGATLCRWSGEDNIEFLYAAGARKVAAAVWVAARLLNRPFAFAVRPEDLASLDGPIRSVARDAAFITCATRALAEAFSAKLPEIAQEKILVLPNLPRYAMPEDEPEARLPAQPGKSGEILVMAPETGKEAFRQVLGVARALRKAGVEARFKCLGRLSLWLRCKLWLSGLRKQVSFTGAHAEENLAEAFRNADVSIVWPLAGTCMDLALPWPVCEAMIFANPIVATAISRGMDILKADANCLLAENVPALSQAIQKLLGDKDLASRLGNQARKDIIAFLDVKGCAKLLSDRIVEAVAMSERSNPQDREKTNGL